MRWKIVCRGLVDLVVVRCSDQSFELDLDVEVSVERKANCVGQVGEECQCVLDWNGGGCVGCCALHELTVSCTYMSQVVVVTCIVTNAKFLQALGGGWGP